jgi:predicted O-methyltransferase YrrM
MIHSFLRTIVVKVASLQFSIRLSNFLIPHIRKESYLDHWVVRPMNGQRNRLRTSFLLCDIFKPDFAIESGSYLGTTTQYLASLATTKTYSIEINGAFAEIARIRLKPDIDSERIEVVDGDSGVHMSRILSTFNPKHSRVFAYLDAHWLEHIPLSEEIQSLLDWGGDFIAVIDDFYIPGDPGFGFDQYKNHRVDVSHVPKSDQISVWIPDEHSSTESGARRGTAYVVSSRLKDLVVQESNNLHLRPY